MISRSFEEVIKCLETAGQYRPTGKESSPPVDDFLGICSPENPKPGHICCCRSDAEYKKVTETASDRPSAVVITHENAMASPVFEIFVEDCGPAFIALLRLFDPCPRLPDKGQNQVIADSAIIADSVKIGHGVTIGENVQIGSGSNISHGVIIEDNSVVGQDCDLHSGVVVRHGSQIGDRVIIHSNTVIGSDGYGFQPGAKASAKIPQIGNVVLCDDVEIGANCAIDRATLDSTIIGRATKLDNLIHIAHNCQFGENCFVTAGYMTGGSTRVGNNVIFGGHVTVKDHITIADNIQVGGFSGITNSLTQPGAYAGYPARPMKDFLKIQAAMSFLPDLLKKVRRLTGKSD